MSAKKYKSLTLREKLKIIDEVKSGDKRKKDIAEEYGIPASTLSTILKQEELVRQRMVAGNLNNKRVRKSEFPDVEECLIKWFKQCRDHNVSVGGPILKEKAEEFAKSLGINNFRASNGWLEKFKQRNDIAFRKVCGESASVDDNVCENWKEELKTLLKDYDPKNIFNADETALYYQCLPDKTLTFKNEKCHGGKNSKVRATLLLASNMTGTEKLKPLMIGKYKKPRCFSGVKSFPFEYDANRKAWMNSVVFAQWLLKLDNQMKKEKRKIILFIDNCTAHNDIPKLNAIKVQFLPANTTSKLQPLDQGIIKNFKTLYRKEVVRHILSNTEEEKAIFPINILQAMRMANKSWENVTKKTIANCFKACGFVKEETEPEIVTPDPVEDPIESEWNAVMAHCNVNNDTTFENFVEVDNDVAVVGTLTDDDIVAAVTDRDEADADDDGSGADDESGADNLHFVTMKEARRAVETIRTFIEQSSDIGDHVFSALVTIENTVDTQCKKAAKQSRITDFFNIE